MFNTMTAFSAHRFKIIGFDTFIMRTNGDEKGENSKNRLTRVLNLQQSLQQVGAFAVLLRYGRDSVSIISLYFTVISRLFTNTYKLE